MRNGTTNARLQSAIAALLLLAAAPALAATAPAGPAKPSSYAPRPANSAHVYGAPIDAPLVGRANVRRAQSPRPAAPRHKVSAAAKPAHSHATSSKSAHRKPAVDRPTVNT